MINQFAGQSAMSRLREEFRHVVDFRQQRHQLGDLIAAYGEVPESSAELRAESPEWRSGEMYVGP